ncbi:MAG: Alpha-L-fucosidase [Planctomycetes bacterium ADurb.Bin126]|nr:MAG: Alpha-L-fucosidase [Planctomycetes bacterium ADurb.Bin126]HOD80621.1 alpha-L-fucosidase [Phycisphaerae bacterium]HQL74096.1 alpha-L-fucosidase [Phycisphaerae bacterium]
MHHPHLDRRTFLKTTAAAAAGLSLRAARGADAPASVPSYLKDHAELYARDPRAAALAWFKAARFGLFMHYGLYSILGRGEWVMFREAIPVAEYEKLKDQFRPDKFDADFITDMALDAGMRYVNLTARHHDSFCLFASKHSDYTSPAGSAKRDLVGELAEQCRKKGLGLFLYYSYALDWRHPYFYTRKFNPIARPAYKHDEPRYLWQKDEDFARYIEFVHGQITELLINYGPLAGIWFDPIMGYYARPDLFPIHETYAMIRRLQPQTLISFKQGATGTEDFAAPERTGQSLADRVRKQYGQDKAKVAADAWQANKNKHNEICDTLQPHVWGYKKDDDGKHLDADETLRRLGLAFGQDCNLLMNTGPLADGSIHQVDVKTLREVGRRIKQAGWPAPAKATQQPQPKPKTKRDKQAAPAQ